MDEAPVPRLQPQEYGAIVGPSGRLVGARLAAVCAALVSLLAVCAVVLVSGSSQPTTQERLPGFELSLNSAMETFFKNTAAREQQEATVQQVAISKLAVVPKAVLSAFTKSHTQGLAAAPNPVVKGTQKPAHVAAAPALAAPAAATAATPSVVTPNPYYSSRAAPKTAYVDHYSGSYEHPPAPERAPGGSSPGVVVGATENALNNLKSSKKAAHIEGLSNKPLDWPEPAVKMVSAVAPKVAAKATAPKALTKAAKVVAKKAVAAPVKAVVPERLHMEGLSNTPWSAPLSDFNAPKPQVLVAAPQTADFDVPVPKGMHSGQAFLVKIPGHREREVTVPGGVAPGQLVSIDVPAPIQLSTKSKLEGEEPAAEEPAAEEPAEEPAEIKEPAAEEPAEESADINTESVEEANSAEESGEAATIEAAAKKAQDYATVPIVFGGTPEQQAAAGAVNAVHDLFRKDETVSKKWIPGDTQPIPGLKPLGQTSEDLWTSAPEVYGDQTALHAQSCAARCSSCRTMGAGNWYCQKCGDVCNQLSEAEVKMKSYKWEVGAPRGAVDPMAQAELPARYFRAVGKDKEGYTMHQPMIPAKKRWYQKTTQVTHVNPGGITQITSNPKWPVQSTAGLSSIANLYKPDGELPSNLPTLSSLATVEGRVYKHSLLVKKQRKQALEEEEQTPEEAASQEEAPAVGEAADGEEGVTPEKNPGFIVATPDDQGLEHGAVARKMTTNVNIVGPGGPSYVQIHTMPAENPQHFGAYAKPSFRSEYPSTQTITINPTRPGVRMVAAAPVAQFVSAQPVIAAPSPATSVMTSYQPAAIAARQHTIQTTMGSGGLMFQVPTAPGIAVAPGAAYSQTTTVNRVQPQWGAASLSTTTVTTSQAGRAIQYVQPPQYVQSPGPTMQYVQAAPVQAPPPTMQYVHAPHFIFPAGGAATSSVTTTQTGAIPMQVVAGGGATVQVVRKQTAPNYQSLSPIPLLKPMSFFDKKRRAKQALFRHWDGHEMQVLNVVPEKSDGAINLDPQNWQGNMVISEGKRGKKADEQFSEAMAQVTEGLHAASNSELHYKGDDRTGVTYREYGDVNPAIGEPADPSKGAPKLISSDPFALRPKQAASPLASINQRAGAVPTGAQMTARPRSKEAAQAPAAEKPAEEAPAELPAPEAEESMVVTVPAGLRAGQDFTALTGAGHEEEVTVPAGVKAGGEVEITVPAASQ